MNQVFQLTDKAIKKVKQFQKKQPTGVFRITVEDSGCSGLRYAPQFVEQALPDDLAVKIQDLIIFVDKKAEKYLRGTTLDCLDKGLGLWQWQFSNPNAVHSCGCGESFNVAEKE